MKYYIYIDESGPFDEGFSGANASVVGGICSEHSKKEWQSLHQTHLEIFNNRHYNLNFSYPSHYHCGHLLGGKLNLPKGCNESVVREFTADVFQNVISNSTFGFLSRNVGKRFEYSPQATYVMNLITALRYAFKVLGESNKLIEYIEIVIAQRTINETSRAGTTGNYMASLLDYVKQQLLIGEGDGVTLAKGLNSKNQLDLSTGLGDKNDGLIAADFICCLGRNRKKPKESGELIICNPNQEALLGDYKAFHARQAEVLIKNKYYGSCLDFLCRYFPLSNGSPNIKQLLDALKQETDQDVLQRELPALLSVIHQFSKNRNIAPNMLLAAIQVSELLVEIADGYTSFNSSASIQRQWLNFNIQLLAELSACYNHTGTVGPQLIAEERLTELILKRGKDTGMDATQRQSLLIDVRNRNLNNLFNDYRFEEAYYLAEELSTDRRKMIPAGEADELLGQILGSHGQSCAFMARLDPTWAVSAIELFEQSLENFSAGSHQEDMSRNFLATAAWQAGRLDAAVKYMFPEIGEIFTPEDAIEFISKRLSQPLPEKRAFAVVNCLRIAAAYVEVHKTRCIDLNLRNQLEATAKRIGTDHPYEQWLKWLGIMHLQCEKFTEAELCFSAAKEVCSSHDFTMKTIGSSINLLSIVTKRIEKSDKTSLANEQIYLKDLKSLREQSASFDTYISNTKVIETLANRKLDLQVDRKIFWDLCTFLPFSYA